MPRDEINWSCILSSREAEIIKLLSESESPSSIAQKLGLSPKTVEFHSLKARFKICPTNPCIAHATLFAIQTGLSKL
jgi:DNA-binding NarL/FixJ family response regulator